MRIDPWCVLIGCGVVPWEADIPSKHLFRTALVPLLLAGCERWTDQLSKPVPIQDALGILEQDLQRSSPVVLADVGTTREDAIVAEIASAQCAAKTVNPLVPVVTGPVSLALQGSIQYQATGTASATPSVAFAITPAKQQQVTIPITFVSAEGLPNFYMGQQLTNLANFDRGSDDKTEAGNKVAASKTAAVQTILDKRDKLQTLVDKAKNGFNLGNCKPDPNGVFVPVPPIVPEYQ